MVSLRRELVYSLLVAICLLLAGLLALLRVSSAREQRYQDELSDLRQALVARTAEIQQLRQQLQQKIPAADSAWTDWPTDTTSVH